MFIMILTGKYSIRVTHSTLELHKFIVL